MIRLEPAIRSLSAASLVSRARSHHRAGHCAVDPARLRHHRLLQGGRHPHLQGRAARRPAPAQYIYAPDAPWKYDTDQLAAISEIRTTTAAPIVQRILDAHGVQHDAEGRRPGVADVRAPGTDLRRRHPGRHCRGFRQPAAAAERGGLGRRSARSCWRSPPTSHSPCCRSGRSTARCAELKTASDKFQQQNLLLDTALENMVAGAGDVRCRGARRDRQRPLRADLRPSSPAGQAWHDAARDSVAPRRAHGLYTGMQVEDVVRTMRERVAPRQVEPHHQQARRWPHHRRCRPPRADGGWVVTHEDVTERETLTRGCAQNSCSSSARTARRRRTCASMPRSTTCRRACACSTPSSAW